MNYLLVLVLTLLFATTGHSQYFNKYVFNCVDARESQRALAPGTIGLRWSLNPLVSDQSQKVEENKFVVELLNLFEEVLQQDTTSMNYALFNPAPGENYIVRIKEVGGTQQADMVLNARGGALPAFTTRTDSLNYALLHGHFFHALAILYKMDRPDIVEKIAEQYETLFATGYRGSTQIFNSYFDPVANDLIVMPYVSNTKTFLKQLRPALSSASIPNNFELHVVVGADNTIKALKTQVENSEAVMTALSFLEIDNHHNTEAELMMIINTKRSRWKLINIRALTDPSSKDFKLRPLILPTGAVHR